MGVESRGAADVRYLLGLLLCFQVLAQPVPKDPITEELNGAWSGSSPISSSIDRHQLYRLHELIIGGDVGGSQSATVTVTASPINGNGNTVEVGTMTVGANNAKLLFRGYYETLVMTAGGSFGTTVSVVLSSMPSLDDETLTSTEVFSGWGGSGTRSGSIVGHDSDFTYQISLLATASTSGTYDIFAQASNQDVFVKVGAVSFTAGVSEPVVVTGRYSAMMAKAVSAVSAGSLSLVVSSYTAELVSIPGDGSHPVADTTALVMDPLDTTKLTRIDTGAVATATTRTITMPDQDVDLTPGGTFLGDLVQDVSPQLGAMLDANSFGIGDGTRLILDFVEDASAVNYFEMENEATLSGPILRSAGSDTDVDINLEPKGTGDVVITGELNVVSNSAPQIQITATNPRFDFADTTATNGDTWRLQLANNNFRLYNTSNSDGELRLEERLDLNRNYDPLTVGGNSNVLDFDPSFSTLGAGTFSPSFVNLSPDITVDGNFNITVLRGGGSYDIAGGTTFTWSMFRANPSMGTSVAAQVMPSPNVFDSQMNFGMDADVASTRNANFAAFHDRSTSFVGDGAGSQLLGVSYTSYRSSPQQINDVAGTINYTDRRGLWVQNFAAGADTQYGADIENLGGSVVEAVGVRIAQQSSSGSGFDKEIYLQDAGGIYFRETGGTTSIYSPTTDDLTIEAVDAVLVTSASAQFSNIVGIGATPVSGIELYIEAAASPTIRIHEDGTNANSNIEIVHSSDSGAQFDFNNGVTDGGFNLDVNPLDGDGGAGTANVRVFRSTDAGAASFQILEGDDSGTINHRFDSGTSGVVVDLALNGGITRLGGPLELDDGGFLIAVIPKTANETVNNTDTKQADDAFVFAGVAGADYYFEIKAMVESNASADFAADFTVPTGALAFYNFDAGSTALGESASADEMLQATVTGTRIRINISCWVDMDSTSGNITFRWAQDVAHASTTTVYKGSLMKVWET